MPFAENRPLKEAEKSKIKRSHAPRTIHPKYSIFRALQSTAKATEVL